MYICIAQIHNKTPLMRCLWSTRDQTNAVSGHAETALAPQLNDADSQVVYSKLSDQQWRRQNIKGAATYAWYSQSRKNI